MGQSELGDNNIGCTVPCGFFIMAMTLAVLAGLAVKSAGHDPNTFNTPVFLMFGGFACAGAIFFAISLSKD